MRTILRFLMSVLYAACEIIVSLVIVAFVMFVAAGFIAIMVKLVLFFL